MILWKFLFSKELEKIWINEVDIYNASIILNSAFWSDFFIEIEEKLSNTHKWWTIKLFNAPLIYQILTYPTVENNIMLIELANILKIFSNEKTINEYIKRLKDDNLTHSAMFELFVAYTFIKNWFKINLQKENYLNNPVEVHFEQNWINFWIECKSYKFKPTEETFTQKLIRKINYLIDKLPKYTAVSITLENEPIDDVEINNIANCCITSIQNFSKKHNDKDEIEQFKYWVIEYINYNETDIESTFKKIQKKSVEVFCKSIAKENRTYSWLPEADSIDNKYINIMWIWTASNSPINDIIYKEQNLLDDISKKIKQQDNILKTKDEVIIIFDKNAYKILGYDNTKKVCWQKYTNYANLTILICEFITNTNNWIIEGELMPLFTSQNFNNLYN